MPLERIAVSRDASFRVHGGRYLVTVAGKFGDSGSVELHGTGVHGEGDVFATFAAAGSQTVELRYGTYSFIGSNVAELMAAITTAAY